MGKPVSERIDRLEIVVVSAVPEVFLLTMLRQKCFDFICIEASKSFNSLPMSTSFTRLSYLDFDGQRVIH